MLESCEVHNDSYDLPYQKLLHTFFLWDGVLGNYLLAGPDLMIVFP